MRARLLPVNAARRLAKVHGERTVVERIGEARCPETVPLRSISSIGPITALTFVLTLGNLYRFTHNRDLGGAYLGLRRRQHDRFPVVSSADSQPRATRPASVEPEPLSDQV